jgi:hypothetical protein
VSNSVYLDRYWTRSRGRGTDGTRCKAGDQNRAGGPEAVREAIFRAIDEGLHLGYRKGQTAGKWVMRNYAGAQSYKLEPVGTADDTIHADGTAILSFAQAQAIARQRFVQGKRVAAGQSAQAAGPHTVKQAIEEYLQWMEEDRKTSKNTRHRAEALILAALGDIVCARLTTKQVRDWRDGLAKLAPRIRTKKGKPPRHREPEMIRRKTPDVAGRPRTAPLPSSRRRSITHGEKSA